MGLKPRPPMNEPEHLARLRAGDVRAAIAEHLPPGEARVLLVGARPQLEAAFTGAGFAADQVEWIE